MYLFKFVYKSSGAKYERSIRHFDVASAWDQLFKHDRELTTEIMGVHYMSHTRYLEIKLPVKVDDPNMLRILRARFMVTEALGLYYAVAEDHAEVARVMSEWSDEDLLAEYKVRAQGRLDREIERWVMLTEG